MKKINLVFVLVVGLALLAAISGAMPSIAVNNLTNNISDDKTLDGTSYVIVHALNPEGIEIGSIEGMNPHCVEIYDGDTLIGYK